MRPLVGAGLKMHLTPSETDRYLADLRPLVAGIEGCDLFVLPSFPALWVARDRLAGSNVAWGAQDVHEAEGGAHTGDVSARMLADLGCTYVEVGHAERRRDHGETDALVGAKAARAMRHGLVPIVCVGEAAEGSPEAALGVVRAQVRAAVGGAFAVLGRARGRDDLVVAYEPVWAIGAGARAAAPAHVAALCSGIHAELLSDASGGTDARVIYGGSVDPPAAAAIVGQDGVDGLFVGRSALDPRSFAAIAAAVASGSAR